MTPLHQPRTKPDAEHQVELAVHHRWGLAKTYFATSMEAYAVAAELEAEGLITSISVGWPRPGATDRNAP